MNFYEVNFDGLVGPNHNYAGLAEGNLASAKNSNMTSYPKKAALQGLEKMRLLNSLGLKQAVIPPQARPDLQELKKFGFEGNDKELLNQTAEKAPELLAAVYSSSAMWTANCATVTPSADSEDNRAHLTPANLVTNFHRSIEGDNSYNFLKKVFHDSSKFSVHPPLPKSEEFSDEGAANHIRFSKTHYSQGIELFAFGKGKGYPLSSRFKARQDINACKAIIKSHKLNQENSVLAMQSLTAIDAGVFHNDVISTGNEDLFILHEFAFENQQDVKKELLEKFQNLTGKELFFEEIQNEDLRLNDAVASYIFNTQVVTLPDNSMVMIAPLECREINSAATAIEKIIAGPSRLNKVIHVDLRQSMQNGGGPACLRLRVQLSEEEFTKIHQGVVFNETLDQKLCNWVNKHYRDELNPSDLLDFKLVEEIRTALDELTQILDLGSFYHFQK